MQKLKLAVTKTKVRGKTNWCVRVPSLDGKRTRRFFDSKQAAETFLQLKKTEQVNYGVRGVSLTEQARADFLWCEAQLKPYGMNVRQGIETLLPQLRAREHGLSVVDAVQRLISSKRAVGVSGRHLYTIENRLTRFAAEHPERTLASFTLRDIEQWLNVLPIGAQSVNHYKATLHSLFAYGLKIGACVANPVSGIDSRKVVRSAPSILTPAQLSALLTGCGDDTEMLAFVAVAAFAGLRRAEIERLQWGDVNLARGFITVTPLSDTKVKNRRLVPVCAALRDWLAPLVKTAGPLAPKTNFRRRFDDARKAAGLFDEWDGNELRHSFASYRLAETQKTEQTAKEIGNSKDTLEKHYMALVTPDDAAAWFAVKPSAAGNVVAMAA